MNCDKEMKLNQPKSKVQGWRIGLILGFIVAFGMINNGCQCDCEEATDEYYVKYEVYSDAHPYIGVKLHTTVNNEDDTDMNFTFNANTQWETIIGPVQKGFKATLEVSTDGEILIHAKIYVSKNDSPFAIKASDGSDLSRSIVQLSYTIDY